MLSLAKFPDNFVTLNLVSIQFLNMITGLIKKRASTFFSAIQSRLLLLQLTSTNPNFDSPAPASKQEMKKSSSHAMVKPEVEMVLTSLGMACDSIPSKLDAEDLFDMFEEQDPSLHEIRLAFDVFDEGRDGFIDAEDLQKVLLRLGLREGEEIEDCRRMIGAVDDNGDGRLDFQEFFKLMEMSFC